MRFSYCRDTSFLFVCTSSGPSFMYTPQAHQYMIKYKSKGHHQRFYLPRHGARPDPTMIDETMRQGTKMQPGCGPSGPQDPFLVFFVVFVVFVTSLALLVFLFGSSSGKQSVQTLKVSFFFASLLFLYYCSPALVLCPFILSLHFFLFFPDACLLAS